MKISEITGEQMYTCVLFGSSPVQIIKVHTTPTRSTLQSDPVKITWYRIYSHATTNDNIKILIAT